MSPSLPVRRFFFVPRWIIVISSLYPYLQQILPILTMSNATNRCRIFSLLLKNKLNSKICCVFFPSHCCFSREKQKKWRYLHEEVSLGVIENRFFMSPPNNAIFPTFACPKKTTKTWWFFFFLAFLLLLFSLGEHWCCKWDEGCKIKESFRGDLSLFFMHIKNPPQKERIKKYCDMPFAIRDEYF